MEISVDQCSPPPGAKPKSREHESSLIFADDKGRTTRRKLALTAYTISGGGESFAIDGYRDTLILEAKHVLKAGKSPYVPGSAIREDIRTMILEKVRDDLTRVRKIIKSEETPFKSVEIITNSPEAKSAFEALLKELSVPGKVRLEP